MNRKGTAIWLSFVFVFSFIVIIVEIAPVVEAPKTWYVDDVPGSGGPGDPPENFTSIQDAINASSDGDTVFVYNGTYYENVVINKTINLTGEDRNNTILIGSGDENVVYVNANCVNISDFKVTNGGFLSRAGIALNNAQNCKLINNNVLSNNFYGINLLRSSKNDIIYNNVSSNLEGGIIIWEYSNDNIVAGNTIDNNPLGIGLGYNSDNNNITGNTFENNVYGIYLLYPAGLFITDNTISNNEYGIYISGGSGINIQGNIISNNDCGIRLYSTMSTIIGNTMMENGIFIEGSNLEHWNTHNIDSSNTVNGKPVYYWKNRIGGTIPSDAGQVILANCTNVLINSLVLSGGTVGIQLGFSSGNEISWNDVSSNRWYGIYLRSSDNNKFILNTVSNNSKASIHLGYSKENTLFANLVNNGIWIEGNKLEYWNSHEITVLNTVNGKSVYYLKDQNGGSIPSDGGQVILANCTNVIVENQDITNCSGGVVLGFSSHNYITSNIVSNNKYGIYQFFSSNNNIEGNTVISNTECGIYITASSSYNKLKRNNISNNGCGIIVLGYYLYNKIIENNISYNEIGIYLKDNRMDNSPQYNYIYHNNFINNMYQTYVFTGFNFWDNGYPSGGNYWSDYNGPDVFKGPYQDKPGSDGIGDTYYYIYYMKWDPYPLMEPYEYKPLENYTILKQGWNLISIPLIQNNQNLKKVLEMIDGYYDAVQWYDTRDKEDPWKHHKVDKPFGNDLFEIKETTGFWIHITQPGDTIFLYNGTQPTSNQTITLHPGWNLVGYPALSKKNRDEALNNISFPYEVDSIWTYNATTQKWKEIGPSDYFELGRGYWIHAKTTCVWEVPI